MKGSPSWLLENVFRDEAVTEILAYHKDKTPEAASAPLSEDDLHAVTMYIRGVLETKLGIKISYHEFQSNVTETLREIDKIVSANIKIEYDQSAEKDKLDYQSVLVKTQGALSNPEVVPLVAEHLSNVSKEAEYMIKKQLKEQLAEKRRKFVEKHKDSVDAISKLHRDRLPDDRSAFTSLGEDSKTQGVSTGYLATRPSKPGDINTETFMVKKASKVPNIRQYTFAERVEKCKEIFEQLSPDYKNGEIAAAITASGVTGYETDPIIALTDAIKLKGNIQSDDQFETLGIAAVESFMTDVTSRLPSEKTRIKKFNPLEIYSREIKKGKFDPAGKDTVNRDRNNTTTFFYEYLMALFYERILYNRTPTLAVVVNPDPQEALFRSKFLPEFKTVAEYTEDTDPSKVSFGDTTLTGVKGAAKLIAALLAGGEQDRHAGNIGVMTEEELGVKKSVFAKIDHGWSTTMLFTNGEDMWTNFNVGCKKYEYKGNISINIKEFREAFDQILMLKKEYIADLIKSRLYELKQMGFDPRGLSFPEFTDNLDYNSKSKSYYIVKATGLDAAYTELEGHILARFKAHRVALKEFRDLVELIEITKKNGQEPTTGWSDGEWLVKMDGKHPIVYAAENNCTVGGMPPIEYALKNNIKIDKKSPIFYAAKEGIRIKGQDPILYAYQSNIEIDGSNVADAYEFAARNGFKVDYQDAILYLKSKNRKIDGLDPIEYAIKNGIKVDYQDAILYLRKQNRKIDGLDPILYAVNNGIKVDGKDPIIYLKIHNEKIGTLDPVDYAIKNGIKINDSDLIKYREDIGLEIEGLDIIEYAMTKGLKINDTDPIIYAIKNSLNILQTEESYDYDDMSTQTSYTRKDPIEFVLEQIGKGIKIKINDLDPILALHDIHTYYGKTMIEYAVVNDIEINGESALPYAMKKGVTINGKDPTLYAYGGSVKIGDFSAIEYAVLNNIKISGLEPIIYAICYGVTINKQDPTLYAVDKGMRIGNLSPIEYAIENAAKYNIKINGQDPKDYAADLVKPVAIHYVDSPKASSHAERVAKTTPVKESPKAASHASHTEHVTKSSPVKGSPKAASHTEQVTQATPVKGKGQEH